MENIVVAGSCGMFSWFKYLSVVLDFSQTLGLWSGDFFLIAPFPDHCLLVPFSTFSTIQIVIYSLIRTLAFCYQYKKRMWLKQ